MLQRSLIMSYVAETHCAVFYLKGRVTYIEKMV